MVILGINHAAHDAAASLLVDGRVIAVAEEERFNRKKHAGDVPVQAMQFCLAQAGLRVCDIDHLAFFYDPYLLLRKRMRLMLRYFPSSLHVLREMAGVSPRTERLRMFLGEDRLLRARLFAHDAGLRYRFRYVVHHLCHAASAFLLSPFEEAAILSLDGAGESATTWLGRGQGTRLACLAEVHLPHSLGLLYSAVTDHLGFRPWSAEGKVMGLAAYGDPARYLPAFREIVRLQPDGGYTLDMRYFRYHVRGWTEWVSDRFIAQFGPRRVPESEITREHQDIAAALQVTTEEAALHVARALHRATGARALCLVGGVALNCVMNGRLLREGPFEDVFVQPMANDAGTSLGAALWVHHVALGCPRGEPLHDVYLGPAYDDETCRAALERHGLHFHRSDDVAEETAALLADGKIVAWFQGRMEVGPRALGNRSILADPRRAEMKDVLNARVKRREGFRPFAPSVLAERADDYFEHARPSPYMILNFHVRPEKRAIIPAVTHVDGTARVQTVTAEANPLYHRLIAAFERRTGVPVLLNTSFNVRGEPIVNTPDEAVTCFLGTAMDRLVLGSWIAEKPPGV